MRGECEWGLPELLQDCRWPHWVYALPLVLLALLSIGFGRPVPVAAHAELERASPAPDSLLTVPPRLNSGSLRPSERTQSPFACSTSMALTSDLATSASMRRMPATSRSMCRGFPRHIPQAWTSGHP